MKPRRRFLRSLAAAPLLPAALADAQTAPAPAVTPSPAPAPAEPLEWQADALSQAARARYGEALSPDELAEVRRGIEANLRAAARLRRSGFGNADEPVTRFSPRGASR